MSSLTNSEYCFCPIEGIVCSFCNGRVPVYPGNTLVNGILEHEKNCDGAQRPQPEHSNGDTGSTIRRQSIVSTFVIFIRDLVTTLLADVPSMNELFFKTCMNDKPDWYVFCTKCNMLVVNKYCHRRAKEHWKFYEKTRQLGYTSKLMPNGDKAKVLPASFSFGDNQLDNHVFCSEFITELNRQVVAGGIDLSVAQKIVVVDRVDNGLDDKLDILVNYAATVVQPFEMGHPPAACQGREKRLEYRDTRMRFLDIEPAQRDEFWSTSRKTFRTEYCDDVKSYINQSVRKTKIAYYRAMNIDMKSGSVSSTFPNNCTPALLDTHIQEGE